MCDNSALSQSNLARTPPRYSRRWWRRVKLAARRDDIVYTERRTPSRIVAWHQVFSLLTMSKHGATMLTKPREAYTIYDIGNVWTLARWQRPALEVCNVDVVWSDDIPF